MEASTLRKRRLERLIELAQVYRGWTRKDLARTLGRDPTKLIPGTGVPKLDLVVQLSRVLDWPVGDVVAFLWGDQTKANPAGVGDYESLDAAAKEAHRDGQYERMIEMAEKALSAARTADERAMACNRAVGAYDGLGRYTEVLRAAQRGLAEPGVNAEIRRMLQVNLAGAYYSLWQLTEARSIAKQLIGWYASNPPQSVRGRRDHAFARYVLGHSYRRLISVEAEDSDWLAARAHDELVNAERMFTTLAAERGQQYLEGVARTCAGGLLEVEVELGEKDARQALETLLKGLDDVQELSTVGDLLESYGWWCIFGCNMALRHVRDDRDLQHYMAIFTNKADEIANKLDNWAMRERVFTMHYARWERATGATGFDIPCVIDEDDVRMITGTMGRFPTFRDTGWQILQSAQVVGG